MFLLVLVLVLVLALALLLFEQLKCCDGSRWTIASGRADD
jgi:hypothetical protein